MLFVPPGWHHTVLNTTDALSINHNWINAHSLHWTWALLRAQVCGRNNGIMLPGQPYDQLQPVDLHANAHPRSLPAAQRHPIHTLIIHVQS